MSRLFTITVVLGAALASGAALAQAPRGLLERPPAEAYPNLSGGAPQLKGEANAQAWRAPAADTTAMGAAAFPFQRDAERVFTRYGHSGFSAAARPSIVTPRGEEPPRGWTPF